MARQFDTIIKGGTVHTGAESKVADVAIKGEKIAKIAKNLSPDGATIIDAAGKLVLPGMIDVHVHLQLPFCGTVSSDDFESGTRAAARVPDSKSSEDTVPQNGNCR